MTFLEAALEILKREGLPLHGSIIAKKAVAAGLLSHVGKTPEQTMYKQLSSAVVKEGGPLVKVRPGVFALASWNGNYDEKIKDKETQPSETESKTRKKHRPKKKQEVESEAIKSTPPEHINQNGHQVKKNEHQIKKPIKSTPPEHINQNGHQVKKNEPSDLCLSSETLNRIYAVLKQSSAPLSAADIANQIKMTYPQADIVIDAALKADVYEKKAHGQTPLFVSHKNGWDLLEKKISKELLGAEQELFSSIKKLNDIAISQLYKKMANISGSKLLQMVILYLRQTGYRNIEIMNNSKQGLYNIKAISPLEEGAIATAVIIVDRDKSKPVNELDIIAARGSLHHFSASFGLLITAHKVTASAIKEADSTSFNPIKILDGKTLASRLVYYGISAVKRKVEFCVFDESAF
jgi:restriction endonuclease Mrr